MEGALYSLGGQEAFISEYPPLPMTFFHMSDMMQAQEAARTIATAAFDILAVPLAAVPVVKAHGKPGPLRGEWEPSR